MCSTVVFLYSDNQISVRNIRKSECSKSKMERKKIQKHLSSRKMQIPVYLILIYIYLSRKNTGFKKQLCRYLIIILPEIHGFTLLKTGFYQSFICLKTNTLTCLLNLHAGLPIFQVFSRPAGRFSLLQVY